MRVELPKNLLLARLGTGDLNSLLPGSGPVTLQAGTKVMIAGQRLAHVHFPIDCAISLLVETGDQPPVEIGLIGREGMLGVPLILGARQSSESGLVQASGLAVVVATHNMDIAGRMDRRVTLRDGLVIELE